MSTSPEFLRYEAMIQHPPAHQRRGQYAFNLLYEIRPDIAQSIRGTVLDPFHQDKLLPAFMAAVEERW